MLTDGVPEALMPNGEPIGYDRVAQLLDGGNGTAAEWLDGRIDAIRATTEGEPDDDWTLVAIERTSHEPDPAGAPDHSESENSGGS